MTRLAARLLCAFSRNPQNGDFDSGDAEVDYQSALNHLCALYPKIESLIANQNVRDYGSGTGRQVIAMAEQGARFVIGLDTQAGL